MMQAALDGKQRIQEAEYEYPYHYIPTSQEGCFSQVQYWSWGIRYLGGIQVVLDQLENLSFDSLIDVGCGDGRFLREVAKRYPNTRLLGVDVSKTAVRLARAMNPDLDYKAMDIMRDPLSERFGVASMIEVLEHVPPDQIPPFLEATASIVCEGGTLIITVPHVNKGVQPKHYQHFTSDYLRHLLEPHFEVVAFIPFDPRSRIMRILQRLLGGQGNHFVITNHRLISWYYRLYRNRYLYADDEHTCGRIAAVCRKK